MTERLRVRLTPALLCKLCDEPIAFVVIYPSGTRRCWHSKVKHRCGVGAVVPVTLRQRIEKR